MGIIKRLWKVTKIIISLCLILFAGILVIIFGLPMYILFGINVPDIFEDFCEMLFDNFIGG